MLPPASALHMMAARVSDEVLCKELGKYGEKVKLPLNDSKRSILQKKLNHLQAKNKRKSTSIQHKSFNNEMSGFSSDDDSALVNTSTTKTLPKSSSASSRTTRAAAAAAAASNNASPPPSPSNVPKRRSMSNLNNSDHLSDNTHNNSKYGLHSPTSGSNQTSRKSPGVISYHSSLGGSNTSIDSLPGNSIYSNHQVHHRRSANLKPPVTTSSRTGIYFDSTDSDIDADEDENSIASKSSTFSNSFAKSSPIYSSHYSPLSRTGNFSSPTLSVTSTPKKKTTQILNEFRQNFTKTPQNPYKSNFWDNYIPYGFNGSRHVGEKNSHCISRILPIAMVLFFTFLGIMYVRNWSEPSLSPENNKASKLVAGVCSKYLQRKCETVDIDGILKLLKMFRENLSIRYGNILCGQNSNGNSKNMSKEVVSQLIAAEVEEEPMIIEQLIMWMIISNEDWGIRPLTVNGTIPERVEELAYVESYTPYMSFTCRLRRAIFDTIYQLLLGCLGVVLLILLLRFCLVQHQKKEEEQQQIYEMIEKIIDTLKSECEAMSRHDEEPYLAVQHVRDKLLQPSKRKQLLPIWKKAAKFIEENESRIRHETRMIEGEEFDVWRWLPVCCTNSPHMTQSLNLNNGGKIWQGQAFGEHDDISNNSPPYSPTPCLKVRNMFKADVEEGDDWDVHIEDAILEKCKNINGILHIHVDKSSKEGCVYIKCDNCETAGHVYRSLHGWWFDRRLVTVKYLRLDMYHDRFPSSRVAVKAMKPSSHSRTHSVCQQPIQRYSLQMT
ncbi:inner nuclear membrane protein Man1 [Octopus bimaculoides]|nr:inner nuclear membrane protein Man1 [Octopus bimaculoides]